MPLWFSEADRTGTVSLLPALLPTLKMKYLLLLSCQNCVPIEPDRGSVQETLLAASVLCYPLNHVVIKVQMFTEPGSESSLQLCKRALHSHSCYDSALDIIFIIFAVSYVASGSHYSRFGNIGMTFFRKNQTPKCIFLFPL